MFENLQAGRDLQFLSLSMVSCFTTGSIMLVVRCHYIYQWYFILASLVQTSWVRMHTDIENAGVWASRFLVVYGFLSVGKCHCVRRCYESSSVHTLVLCTSIVFFMSTMEAISQFLMIPVCL